MNTRASTGYMTAYCARPDEVAGRNGHRKCPNPRGKRTCVCHDINRAMEEGPR